MLNMTKFLEYYNPSDLPDVHIIGCGAIGSTLAENLVRIGVTKFHLWDFDHVAEHNLANQMFRVKDINNPKVSALEDILKEINLDVECTLHVNGYPKDQDFVRGISGYVFLCVDSIDMRRKIMKQQWGNTNILAMFDFRMELTAAQHYATFWNDEEAKQKMFDTMDFTEEEAKSAVPVNACGSALSVAPTVRAVVAQGVANFMSASKNKELVNMLVVYPFMHEIDAF